MTKQKEKKCKSVILIQNGNEANEMKDHFCSCLLYNDARQLTSLWETGHVLRGRGPFSSKPYAP